jgi:hypothetical protein
MKIDGGREVRGIAETTGFAFDTHDLAIESSNILSLRVAHLGSAREPGIGPAPRSEKCNSRRRIEENHESGHIAR